ncbi:hypothetical protein CRENBAI_021097 [Crenichthys baileyi]|uniref:Uncharacterized protein n=1 Tax=Crenichthys baileyi TaxID=28760 RepID=A0AAV9S3T8_9TELE
MGQPYLERAPRAPLWYANRHIRCGAPGTAGTAVHSDMVDRLASGYCTVCSPRQDASGFTSVTLSLWRDVQYIMPCTLPASGEDLGFLCCTGFVSACQCAFPFRRDLQSKLGGQILHRDQGVVESGAVRFQKCMWLPSLIGMAD